MCYFMVFGCGEAEDLLLRREGTFGFAARGREAEGAEDEVLFCGTQGDKGLLFL